MFWKKPSVVAPVLGKLTFSHDYWLSDDVSTPAGIAIISIEGDKSSPDPGALAVAKDLALDPMGAVDQAKRFLDADSRYKEFAENNGTLEFNGFRVMAQRGTFEVNFGLSDWPDAMIEVTFENGFPKLVELGD